MLLATSWDVSCQLRNEGKLRVWMMWRAMSGRHYSADALGGMRRCRGLQLGLVGLGPVALGVARRAAAFGMRVVACDPAEGAQGEGSSVVGRCRLTLSNPR
jgi:phosphoglycerate dehydrogenase-like enzyme